MTSRRKWTLVGALIGFAAAVGVMGFVRADRVALDCKPSVTPGEWSIARHWNETALDAIRRDLPAPTVHARNLFHLSVAMWDAWAAYDDAAASGYLVEERHRSDDVVAARNEAISYAAYRVLEHRYIEAVGSSETIPQLDGLMASLCYPIDVIDTEGESPAALGNRIAANVVEWGLADGSNGEGGYEDPGYSPVNDPLAVVDSGTVMVDPNRWQPLQIRNMVSQNGILLDNGTQEFIDPHWGWVDTFALPSSAGGLPIDPGDPPYLGDPTTDREFKDAGVEVIRFSSRLGTTAGTMIDISPASLGNNTLGANDGSGHAVNPATGERYEPNLVDEGEFGRAVAEFWADGPASETPPGIGTAWRMRSPTPSTRSS